MVRPHGRTSDTAGTSGIIPCRTTSHPLSGSGDPTPRVPARNTFFLSSSLMTSSKDNPPVCTGKKMTLWSSIERRDPFDSRVSQNPSFGGFLPRGDDTREPCMTSASGSFHLVVLVRVSARSTRDFSRQRPSGSAHCLVIRDPTTLVTDPGPCQECSGRSQGETRCYCA